MIRTHRRRIALFLSLLMTAFLFCQGVAQAAVMGAMLPEQSMPMGINCPMSGSTELVKSSAGAAMDCQHLDKATADASHLLSALDILPMVAFLLPALGDEVGVRQLAALSPIPPDPDPPPTIRFHRFRE